MKKVETHVASLINGGVDELKRFIPETEVMLAPILNTAFDAQNSIHIKILTPLKVTSRGSWNTHIFVNGCTHNFHAEKDCAYTCIHVPMQDSPTNTAIDKQPSFLFQLNDNQRLLLPLSKPISFMYNAQYVNHRQAYYPSNDEQISAFVNVSSYGNEKIFNHLRRSFQRLIE